MPHILRKLTSCIQRHHISKEIKPVIVSLSNHYLKFSRFELMPDEILIEIFEYLPLIDLYNAFVNLNFRLNILLRDVRIGINLHQNEEITNEILYYFSKQIFYIHIDHYPLLNLKYFKNLRSLIIYLPTKNQLLSINNELMPYLNRLWIGIINPKDENILWNNLFGNKQFLKLNSCYLFQINLNENLYLYKTCFNIRILSITNIKTKDFLLILSLLPNLYQLQICISDVFLTSENHLTNIYHRNLRILKIEFLENLSQLNHLNLIISFVPYIQQCHLILVNLIKIKDYVFLQNIISQKLLKLKQFICSIDYFCQLSSNQMIQKFQKLKIKLPFFQTIKIIPCDIHQDKCLRKIWMNKTIIPIY
jgi:hypothetical protein